MSDLVDKAHASVENGAFFKENYQSKHFLNCENTANTPYTLSQLKIIVFYFDFYWTPDQNIEIFPGNLLCSQDERYLFGTQTSK